MSAFVSYFDGSIALASSKLTVQTLIKNNLVSAGWRVDQEDTTNLVLDMLPPSGETIGDGVYYEVCRIKTEDLKIRFYGYSKTVADARGQIFFIRGTTVGNNPTTVTINGVGVTQSASGAGYSIADNMHQLYNDLVASGFNTDWTFTWMPPMPGGDQTTIPYIIAKRITVSGTNLTVTGTGGQQVTQSTFGIPSGSRQKLGVLVSTVTSSPRTDIATYTHDLTIDLTNGCVYYMSVFNRTFMISIQTNAGFFGPVFMSYVDNATARSFVPTDALNLCSPAELTWGNFDKANTAVGNASMGYIYYTHGFVRLEHTGTFGATGLTEESQAAWRADPLGAGVIPRVWVNATMGYSGYQVDKDNVGPFFGASIANSIELDNYAGVRLSTSGIFSTSSSTDNTAGSCFFSPANPLPDVYMAMGSAPSQGIMLTQDPDLSTTTTATYDATTAYTTVTVASTTGFGASGYFYLNGEAWSYGAKTSNSFTSCTRAVSGTYKAASTSGAKLWRAGWFVKIGKGLLAAGDTQPA